MSSEHRPLIAALIVSSCLLWLCDDDAPRCCNSRCSFTTPPRRCCCSSSLLVTLCPPSSRFLFPFLDSCSNYWLQWIFLAASWAFFILIDMLFLTEDTFIYDPSYKTWSVRAGYEEK